MSHAMPTPKADLAEYFRLKTIVTDNWTQTCECMRAVYRIRAEEMFLLEYSTWNEWCERTLHVSRRHVNRLMAAAELAETLMSSQTEETETPEASAPTVTNEWQARSLSSVPPEERPEALRTAATAGSVAGAALAWATRPPAPPEHDKTGVEIPRKALDLWKRRDEVQKLLTAISHLRTALRRAQEENDPLYWPLTGPDKVTSWNTLLTSLDNAYASLGLAMPHAVCPTCKGLLEGDKCATCHGRLWVSDFFYKNCVPAKTRAMREGQTV